MPVPPNRYRLYIDEAGDHTRSMSETDPIGRRYLCLLGVMVRMGEDYTRLQASVEEAKRAHLPYDPDAPPIRIARIFSTGAERSMFSMMTPPAQRSTAP